MRAFVRCAAAAALAVAAAWPARLGAEIFALDPASATLPLIPASAGDILAPAGPPAPGPLPPPVAALPLPALGLIPGDIVDAVGISDDAGPGSTLYFTVSRGSASAGAGPLTPDVFSEVGGVPIGFQPDASSDIFATLDPACAPPGLNSQVLDGNGLAPLAPLTCYPGFGLGLSELNPLGPPLNDQIADFDWALPGRARLFCVFFSLAPGSPTLTPGANPARAAGGEPGDIFVACPGPPAFFGISIPALFSGLVSGGPGCAPPACDDVDALSVFGNPVVSLAPGSPSLVAIPASPADVLSLFTGPPLAIYLPAAMLGLVAATDDVKGLEQVLNPCPIPVAIDVPDFDGVGGCDNCPAVVNPGQEDSDGDLVGDSCDPCTDTDADGFGNPGFPNACPTDLCPFTPGPNLDGDGDGVGDICDNCPLVPNPTQADADFDSIGDACDTCTDVDGDGYGLPTDTTCLGVDNCLNIFNPAQTDGDLDGVGDACDNCVSDANPGQADADADTLGDACDNCPQDANLGQVDLDLDLVGDACDICTGGVGVTKPSIKLNKLLAPTGDDQLQVQGTAAFPGALPLPPLNLTALGMRVQLVDLGNASTVLFDVDVPAGAVPTVCGPKDGWKTNPGLTSHKYGNKTTAFQPACVPGSALGVTGAQGKDLTSKVKGVKFQLKGKNGTYVPATGPFRMSVVLGGPAESAMGQCAVHTFPGPSCVVTGGGKGIKCK